MPSSSPEDDSTLTSSINHTASSVISMSTTAIPTHEDKECAGLDICDNDHVLTKEELKDIGQLIRDIQSYTVTCNDISGSDPFTETQTTTHAHIHLKVYVDHTDYPKNYAEVEAMRRMWGLDNAALDGDNGEDTCGKAGLLLYVAIPGYYDEQPVVRLSRGYTLKITLPNDLETSLMEEMDPLLRQHQYGDAIESGLLHIIDVHNRLEKKRADIEDDSIHMQQSYFYLYIFFMYICTCPCLQFLYNLVLVQANRYRRLESQSEGRIRRPWNDSNQINNSNTSRQQRDKVEILNDVEATLNLLHSEGNAGLYMSTHCPICLQDFMDPTTHELDNSNSSKETPSEETPLFQSKRLGSDGKPLEALPCGHVFDHSCLVAWMVTLNDTAKLKCPVCNQIIQT